MNTSRSQKEQLREWRRANPEKYRAQQMRARKRMRSDPKRWAHRQKILAEYGQKVKRPKRWADPLPTMLSAARMRAKLRGGFCSLTIEDIAAVNGMHCPVFGKRYVIKRGHPNSRTLDKIRPHLWYVPGNVVVVSARANFIKQDATSAELHSMASRLRLIEKGISAKLQGGPIRDLVVLRGRKDHARYKQIMLNSARG